MVKEEFEKLAIYLAKSKCCTSNMQCSKDKTCGDEFLDCYVCWKIELKKAVNID